MPSMACSNRTPLERRRRDLTAARTVTGEVAHPYQREAADNAVRS
jgi:hypothetical protein